jgi:hypothetical protein
MSKRPKGLSTSLSQPLPERCKHCGRFPASFVLSHQWQPILAQLIARHPELGISDRLVRYSNADLWGMFLHLLKLEEL